jgi:preprotein translocase subunit SecY
MWERLRSIWTVPDLRNKILFTLGILLAFRVLANISVPLSPAGQKQLQSILDPSNGGLGQVF